MEIKWIDELPEKTEQAGRVYRSKYDAFGEAVKAHPGRWAQCPTDSMSVTSRRSFAANINTQKPNIPHVFRGKWEAAVRQGILYVRFLGEQ